MKWFGRKSRFRRLEEELVRSRPAPPDRLVASISEALTPRRTPRPSMRPRLALATALTGALVVGLGATGALGYGASSVGSLVKSVAHVGKVTSHRSAQSGPTAAACQYVSPPSIVWFSPRWDVQGAQVSIYGSGFTGTQKVYFKWVPASFTVVSDNKITTTVPHGAPIGPLKVVASCGSATTLNDFIPIYVPRIDWTTPDPKTGAARGDQVIIRGVHFSRTQWVRFHWSRTYDFSVVSDSQIAVTVPSNATSGRIAVHTKAGSGYSSFSFHVIGH